jgi:hypothetical protein
MVLPCRGCESLLGVAEPPGLLVTAGGGPGDDLEVPVQGGLEEPAAAHLLDRDEVTAEVLDAPALCVVVLLRARDHAKIKACDLVCVKISAAADLLDGVNLAAHIRQPPVLSVVVLERPSDHVEVPLLDLPSVQEPYPATLQPDDLLTGGDTLPGDRCRIWFCCA